MIEVELPWRLVPITLLESACHNPAFRPRGAFAPGSAAGHPEVAGLYELDLRTDTVTKICALDPAGTYFGSMIHLPLATPRAWTRVRPFDPRLFADHLDASADALLVRVSPARRERFMYTGSTPLDEPIQVMNTCGGPPCSRSRLRHSHSPSKLPLPSPKFASPSPSPPSGPSPWTR